jgi:hypothetical protein
MKLPGAVLAIVLSGLAGFAAASFWPESKEAGPASPSSAKSSRQASESSPPPRARVPRERSNPEAQHVKLLDHPRPGSADALALLEEFAKERFGAYGGSTTFHTEKLLRLMYEEDPEMALRFLDGIEDRDVAVRMVGLMLFAPGRSEILRLKAWMEGQSDPILRSEILRNMIWSWRGFDGPAALAAIDALPEAEGVDRSKLRALLMERIPVHRQLEVLDDFPLPDREAFFTTHGQTLSSEMPEGIFASIMGLPESVGRDKAMTSVLQQWAQRDPLRAVEAVSKHAAPEVEAHAVRQVAFGWSSGDSLRASQWVDSLPPGPNRDAASAGLAEELATEQPDMAFVGRKVSTTSACGERLCVKFSRPGETTTRRPRSPRCANPG